MKIRYIDPVEELGNLLLNVQKPGRYTGGEAGILSRKNKENKDIFRTLIAFPDLYEIGMCNNALKILYNRLNRMDNISCDRAFAPAPDFEKLLREKNVPLYGLDTGISLACLDMLMFTMGYELSLNGVFLILELSGIPLRCKDRNKDHPLVIAGGPAVSNPLPYSPFIDAFWIGEAEAGFFDLARDLSDLKKAGKGREALLEKISSHPSIWIKGKEKAVRAIYSNFSSEKNEYDVFPIPSMKTVQHHGTVEIMRGCQNGCRFCHAGYWYRPMRQKNKETVTAQVNELVTKGGWQEISLSSLSSGDYFDIEDLVDNLNSIFSYKNISFQMPSLKVSGFALDLLEKLSVTRKSGLTFAVETPLEAWQMAINKEVTRDSVVAILEEAKKRGWKGAKFYFLIGLPLPSGINSEEKEIVDFVKDIGRRTRMHFNINVGIFIPKPHTPYQWASQIDSEEAVKKGDYIRLCLKPLGHKVSVSNPLISQIEGLLSRGDERAGFLCEEAYFGGSRLEAWKEYINKDKWAEILDKNSFFIASILSGKTNELPWVQIDSCVNKEYFKEESEKSQKVVRTSSCIDECTHCGVCSGNNLPQIEKSLIGKEKSTEANVNCAKNNVNDKRESITDPSIYRMLFSFCKEKSAVFHGHLSLIEIFSMSLRRAGIPAVYTKGFNPIAKMEFASPLSTGISAEAEIASVDFLSFLNPDDFIFKMNLSLPEGLQIKRAECFLIKSGEKKKSLASLLWGFTYSGIDNNIKFVNTCGEKDFRKNRLTTDCDSSFFLKRTGVLAKNQANAPAQEWVSYFDVYRFLYGKNTEQ